MTSLSSYRPNSPRFKGKGKLPDPEIEKVPLSPPNPDYIAFLFVDKVDTRYLHKKLEKEYSKDKAERELKEVRLSEEKAQKQAERDAERKARKAAERKKERKAREAAEQEAKMAAEKETVKPVAQEQTIHVHDASGDEHIQPEPIAISTPAMVLKEMESIFP